MDFGALLESNFSPFFGPFRALNFPVLLGFLCSEGRFWAVFRPYFSVHFLGTCVTASRAVFEWPVFMTIPSRRMDSPR